jgi:hypothetical protein
MKLLIASVFVVTLLLSPANAADDVTYAPLSKDNEVETVGDVRVKITKPSEESRSLNQLDMEIAQLEREKVNIDARLSATQALRAKVATEAAKVKLKDKEVPK